jgi:Uncharacterized conserved protein (DUF2278)
MGFANYGVLVGTKTNYYRDPPQFGKYYHGNVEIDANGHSHRCAIDVDTQTQRVQWRIIEFTQAELAHISNMGNGWHHLASNSTSGAIDYIRWTPMLVTISIYFPIIMREFKFRVPRWMYPTKLIPFDLNKFERAREKRSIFRLIVLEQSSFWVIGTNIEAIEQLEYVLSHGTRMFVFGEFFDNGYGVHNIHQNQGDVPGGGHDADNATWQDGATIVQKADGSYIGFFNKFESQSFHTDANGRWLP